MQSHSGVCYTDNWFCGKAMGEVKVPDVSGYKLGKALNILASLGYEKTDIRLTASPRTRQAGYNGDSRVVRQNLLSDDTIVLLVCSPET